VTRVSVAIAGIFGKCDTYNYNTLTGFYTVKDHHNYSTCKVFTAHWLVMAHNGGNSSASMLTLLLAGYHPTNLSAG
jgi:hypothetical protein